jgi:hypothetical protein
MYGSVTGIDQIYLKLNVNIVLYRWGQQRKFDFHFRTFKLEVELVIKMFFTDGANKGNSISISEHLN